MATLMYQPSLDGLRAFAVVAVVLYHFNKYYIPGGWLGVDVFYVLSGYLITSTIVSEIDRSGRLDLKAFYIRRIMRLWPALFAVLAVSFALKFVITPRLAAEANWAALMSAFHVMNFNRAYSWGPEYMLGHTWSLAMEEQFYLLWPTIFILLRGRGLLFGFLGLLIVGVVWRLVLFFKGAAPDRIYNGFDTHLDGLLVGCMLAICAIPDRWKQRLLRYSGVGVGLMAGLLALPAESAFGQTVGLLIAALVTAWLIVAALQDGWLKRVLSLRPIVFTGKLSYSIYLWHFPAMIFIASFNLRGGTALKIALCVVLPVLSYYLIERPFLRLKDHIAKQPPALSA